MLLEMDRPSPLSPSPQRRATGGEIEHASPHTPTREDSGGHLSIKGLDSLELTRSPRNSTRDEDRDHSSPVELTRSRENSVHGPSGGGGPGFMSPEAQLALYPMFFCEERHEQSDVGTEPPGGSEEVVSKWRMKDRMKTTSVALILCLNIGVDPPDVLKISPCARMQCWINPLAMQAQKALDCIGKALQAQYERWQPRAKYRLQLDPTVEDVKKLCASCRRNAKNERVLLHYNGHGVPRPTVNGEVWVFNKSYTQYIPLSVYDLQAWVGKPAIYVFDCSGAGVVVNTFLQLAQHGNFGNLGAPSAGPDARGTTGGGGRRRARTGRRARLDRFRAAAAQLAAARRRRWAVSCPSGREGRRRSCSRRAGRTSSCRSPRSFPRTCSARA